MIPRCVFQRTSGSQAVTIRGRRSRTAARETNGPSNETRLPRRLRMLGGKKTRSYREANQDLLERRADEIMPKIPGRMRGHDTQFHH